MKQSKRSRVKPSPKKAHVDLHLHSTHSDGQWSVSQVIQYASSHGLAALSITDHDNIDSYEEGLGLAEELGIELIPGVEVSSHLDGHEIHILGYLFDPTNLILNKALQDFQEKRLYRVSQIVEKLKQMGVEISLERVLGKATGSSIGRPHIASILVEEEYVANHSEAFEKYLHTDHVCEFDTGKITPYQAIELIHQAGGVAVFAHPDKTQQDHLIPSMIEAGLDGLEVYCNGITHSKSQNYRKIAKEHNLICSGGSDFHNDFYGKRYHIGSARVPYSSLEALKERQLEYQVECQV
jgi:predicted metal-dependent phosphoesterase TrpH